MSSTVQIRSTQQSRVAMRSPRSVKRPHTNHHTTNVRRNRGKQVKNSRLRQKQWAHTLVYSPDVAEKRQLFTHTLVPTIKEVSEEERTRRAERKKEKKLIAKQIDDEARRLELERKEKEREERKRKIEEEQRLQEELEYQKWQEMQKKKEEELRRAEVERKAAEKKAAEEKKKDASQAAQPELKKEKAKKEKKAAEVEKTVTDSTPRMEHSSPTGAPTVAVPKSAVETEKKKKKKEKGLTGDKVEEASRDTEEQKEHLTGRKQKDQDANKSSNEHGAGKKQKTVEAEAEEEVLISRKQQEPDVRTKQKHDDVKKPEVLSSEETKGQDGAKKQMESNPEKMQTRPSHEYNENPILDRMDKGSTAKKTHESTEEQVNVEDRSGAAGEKRSPVDALPVNTRDDEKHSRNKGDKRKKSSENESPVLNNGHDEMVADDARADEGHQYHDDEHVNHHEVHIKEGKKGKKNRKNASESTDFANGHDVNAASDDAAHIVDSAPVIDAPNGGAVLVDLDKKGKEKRHEAVSSEPFLLDQPNEATDKVTHGEPSHDESNRHDGNKEDYTGKSSAMKNKQKEKKVKQVSPGVEITTEVTVVTESVMSENDAPTDQASPPIQVHEVTSTANENGMKETVHTITATLDTTSSTSPTQFAQNVEKLVSHTLKKAKHDIVEIDPNVKMTIDAQLVKLSERKPEVATEHKIHITPLPLELHYSRPTTPSSRERVYKLLPRDIIFCSGLIDAHGEDYAAMAADPKNIYKENARAIQRKVRIFKESPHYQTYLRAKEEGRSVEEVLAEEGQT
ncbi:unnamed protein product [Cylicocyclus nassatus]|uniref:Nucleolar protein 16 n=1 Tax=Cylicocyclus nassatus TaxID=53992 RepID=A0AA36HEZ2_CYLNA|nr:unnamed protein product [Cylicocyclus nassatus]